MVALTIATVSCHKCGADFKSNGLVKYIHVKRLRALPLMCSDCCQALEKVVDNFLSQK